MLILCWTTCYMDPWYSQHTITGNVYHGLNTQTISSFSFGMLASGHSFHVWQTFFQNNKMLHMKSQPCNCKDHISSSPCNFCSGKSHCVCHHHHHHDHCYHHHHHLTLFYLVKPRRSFGFNPFPPPPLPKANKNCTLKNSQTYSDFWLQIKTLK